MKFVSKNRLVKSLTILLAVSTLTACTAVPEGVSVFDPYEEANRDMHAFNKGLDQNVVRPVARAYDAVLPDPVENSVSNFADNLGLPGQVVNNVLQGDVIAAGKNTLRFVVNTTIGIGGLFDPSTIMGLEQDETDFGETLAVWGVGEGAYVELPVFGPSTERDAAGLVVDMALDPMSYILGKPESTYRTGARVGDLMATRNELGGQIDSLYQDSADSYAQFRLIYLQNRRFQLDRGTGESESDDYIDPYEDF